MELEDEIFGDEDDLDILDVIDYLELSWLTWKFKKSRSISTTRPPFRIGYRRRSTTTPQPTITSISTRRPSLSAANTSTPAPSSRTTKLTRRKVMSSRTTSRPVESQVLSTLAPTKVVASRYRFVSRKPYLKTTTQIRNSQASTDQTIESTNHQLLEEKVRDNTYTTDLADIALALQKVQQAPIPEAKPSRKRPQILRISSQYSSRITTTKPNATTLAINKESYTIPYNNNAQKIHNRKTIAITLPYFRGSYVTPQPVTADKFITESVISAEPIIRELYSTPQSITAKDFISKYTSLDYPSTRARVRYSTTNSPLIVITTGRASASKKRKQPQAFEKILTPVKANNYKSLQDYDFYDNIEASVFGKIPEHSKVLLHGNGIIECLDQGNFPHPVSCKKFISCAKMENNKIIGWEYTCPKNLSFDPIGGMCNWSAGLGCNEA